MKQFHEGQNLPKLTLDIDYTNTLISIKEIESLINEFTGQFY